MTASKCCPFLQIEVQSGDVQHNSVIAAHQDEEQANRTATEGDRKTSAGHEVAELSFSSVSARMAIDDALGQPVRATSAPTVARQTSLSSLAQQPSIVRRAITVGYRPVPMADAEDRIGEYLQNGMHRDEALRLVARENIDAEVQESVMDTFAAGSLPMPVVATGRCAVYAGCLPVAIPLSALSICIYSWALFLQAWWMILSETSITPCPLYYWLVGFQCSVMLERMLRLLLALWSYNRRDTLNGSDLVPIDNKGLLYTTFISLVKGAWCLKIITATDGNVGIKDECVEFAHFLRRYSRVLLLQHLISEPCCYLAARIVICLARRGVFRTARGAGDVEATLSMMEIVTFDQEMFAASHDPLDERPSGECVFCLERYESNPAETIVKTWCGHFMHRDCVERWLQTSRFCPICRADLEDSQGWDEFGQRRLGSADEPDGVRHDEPCTA